MADKRINSKWSKWSSLRIAIFLRQKPKLAWLLGGGAICLLLIILLPLLFYANAGFTVVVKGAASETELYVDDVLRGIPAIETIKKDDKSTDALLIRVHGLKAGLQHSIRLKCKGGDAQLFLDDKRLNSLVGEDGDVINILAGDCKSNDDPVEIEYAGRMRLVKAGAFLMGDDQGEQDERPAQVVNLSYSYYIDKYEVTNRQFREFCNATGRLFPSEPFWDRSYSVNNPDAPVLGVSWDDANAYARFAGKALPSEAEWEKAASWDPKATDTSTKWKRRWPWGNTFDGSRLNYNALRPTNVGRYGQGASAYEVYDMSGNAFEWTSDFYNPYPGNQVPDPNYGTSNRVVRGGSLATDKADSLRTTYRSYRKPQYSADELEKKSWLIGFRCIVKVDDSALRKQLKNTNQIK